MTEECGTATIEAIYRAERRRVLATLIRLLGSFDAAEEACQEAFLIAMRQWPDQGVPANPYAWLVSTGRFRTIDRWRRHAKLAASLPQMALLAETETEMSEPDEIRDDELSLIFTCCHPALSADARIALTLREVGGLKTEEVARAFLSRPSTIAQRIVRAKAKIRDENIPYAVPDGEDLAERLESVLRVLYLIFNEGYTATSGPSLTRPDLCREALRLTRIVAGLIEDAEVLGLQALMLLHDARRSTRMDEDGDIILLENQNRALWDRARIAEATALVEQAFAGKVVGPYVLQAAIASVHASATSFAETDWARIVALYDALFDAEPSPVVALNQAIAIGMRDGADEGLRHIEALLDGGQLSNYASAYAARADFLRKLGRKLDARHAYERALDLTEQSVERAYFFGRIREL